MQKNSFTKKLSSDAALELKKVKKLILDDMKLGPVENIFSYQRDMVDFFVAQPFGSQNYPDFLIFTNKYIVLIEIKYSSDKAKKSTWNGKSLWKT